MQDAIPIAGSDIFNFFPKITIDIKFPTNADIILKVINAAKDLASQPNLYFPNKYKTEFSPKIKEFLLKK